MKNYNENILHKLSFVRMFSQLKLLIKVLLEFTSFSFLLVILYFYAVESNTTSKCLSFAQSFTYHT